MTRLAVILLGIALLLWSGIAWLLYALAGAGSSVVVHVTRWLDLEPGTTQWLADGLAAAGGVAQWLVVFIWLLGAAAIGVVGWLLRQAVPVPLDSSGLGRPDPDGPVIEGEIGARRVSKTRPSDAKRR